MNAPAKNWLLLVEDDDDNRELMAEVLESAGYGVTAARSGHEALRALRDRTFALMLTDVGMPGLGGLDVARAVRSRAPSLPIVVVTGYADREDITDARGHEVDAILVKPIDPDMLTETVRTLVR